MKTMYIAALAAMTVLGAGAQDQQYDSDNGVVTIGADRMF